MDDTPELRSPETVRSEQVAKIRRVRLILLILSGVCFAWVALLVQLGMRGKLQWLQAPDWVYAVIVFGPLAAGIALVVIIRRLFRMVG